MYHVYVLKSLKTNKRYVGYTSKSPLSRLAEHNRGCNKFTRTQKPYKLIHTESFSSKAEVIKREKFLKSGQGRKYLDNFTK